MLKLFGERVDECLRESDLLARQGGDEFTVLLFEIEDEVDVQSCAEKYCRVLQKE